MKPLSLAILLLLGCSGNKAAGTKTLGTACTAGSECTSELSCIGGVCSVGCGQTTDCASGQICSASRCVANSSSSGGATGGGATASSGAGSSSSAGSSSGGSTVLTVTLTPTTQTLYVGEPAITLTAAAASGTLTWTRESAPATAAAFVAPSGTTLSFSPDIAGVYTFQAAVASGTHSASAQATVTVLADEMFFTLAGGSCVGLCQVMSDGSGNTLIDASIGDGAQYGIRRLSNHRVAYSTHSGNTFNLVVTAAGQAKQTWFTTTGTSTSDTSCTWANTSSTTACEFPIYLFGSSMLENKLPFTVGKQSVGSPLLHANGYLTYLVDTSLAPPSSAAASGLEGTPTAPYAPYITTDLNTDAVSDGALSADSSKIVLAHVRGGAWGSLANTTGLVSWLEVHDATLASATPIDTAPTKKLTDVGIVRPAFLADGRIAFIKFAAPGFTQFVTQVQMASGALDNYATVSLPSGSEFSDFVPFDVGKGAQQICTASATATYANALSDQVSTSGNKILFAHYATAPNPCTASCASSGSTNCTTSANFAEHAIQIYDADAGTTVNLSTALTAAGLATSGDYFVTGLQFIAKGRQVALLAESSVTHGGTPPTAAASDLYVVNVDGSNPRHVSLNGATTALGMWDGAYNYCGATAPELVGWLACFFVFTHMRRRQRRSAR